MQLKNLIYAAALVTLTVLACQKEVSVTNVPGTQNPTNISAAITGRIVNETGLPVQGAVVKAGTASTSTNINGEFTLANATVVDKAAYITVEKTGYFTGSRTFVARASQKHYVEIELLPKTNSGTINAATGGTVTLTNSGAVTLPANGVVVKSTGAAYTGNVQVAMTWIDPTSDKLMRQMPGDLRGIDEANAEVGLQSFGMLGVELTSPAGEKLQIATGKKATLNFPLPTTIVGAAPATIALWSFNETTGLWKQEGTATKAGTAYTAEVSHFSFWNCDAPFPQVQFSATFKDQNGQPLRYVRVKIKRTAVANSSTQSYTDTAGFVSGIVPKNEALILEVYASQACGTAAFTQNVGPFSSNTNLGTITVTTAVVNYFTVSAQVVSCSSTPVTAGYVQFVTVSGIVRAPLNNGGSFTASIPGCSATQVVTYYAVDSANSQQSAPITTTLNSGINNLSPITACGTSTQRFVNFTIDGVAYNLTSPPDSTSGQAVQGTTVISGFKLGNTATTTSMNFSFTGTATGSAPINYVYIQAPTLNDSTTVQNGAFNVTVTEYGTAGSYIAGSFTGNLTGSAGVLHPVTCNFRVRRN